jgi:hypothetical protein
VIFILKKNINNKDYSGILNEARQMTVYNFGKTFILLLVLAIFSGCLEETGIYSCTYESRSTGCGGKGWKSWKTECYEFDIEATLTAQAVAA